MADATANASPLHVDSESEAGDSGAGEFDSGLRASDSALEARDSTLRTGVAVRQPSTGQASTTTPCRQCETPCPHVISNRNTLRQFTLIRFRTRGRRFKSQGIRFRNPCHRFEAPDRRFRSLEKRYIADDGSAGGGGDVAVAGACGLESVEGARASDVAEKPEGKKMPRRDSGTQDGKRDVKRRTG